MSQPQKYRKKPVVIEAVRFHEDAGMEPTEISQWCGGKVVSWAMSEASEDLLLEIPTLEGTMTATYGDYIIKGVQGEFYPCKPDIFAKTYEAAAK